jgi:hypothetical protein
MVGTLSYYIALSQLARANAYEDLRKMCGLVLLNQ